MRVKKLLAILLATAMIGSLAACGGGESSGDAASGDAAQQETMPNGDVLDKEQYLNGYIFSEPATLDSSKSSDTYGGTVLSNVIEPLTRMEEDENGKNVLRPAGAEKWESNEDGTVWTFHLRDNNWSDGVAVTAKDYEYGIKRVLDPNTGSPNSYLITCIKNADKVNKGEAPVDELGVKALDDKTLEITLEYPTPYFMSLTDGRAMYPLRQDIVEKHGETFGSELDTLVFNGPFVMTGWTHNSEITLAPNDQYWDKDSVKLDSVNWKIINDENAIFNSFDNGSFDLCTTGSPEWMQRFEAKEGVNHTYYITPSVRFHFYNINDPLFQNENIRKAFSLAINREEVAETIYKGTMVPSYSWVPQGVSSGDLGEYRTQVPEPMKTLQSENPDPKALLLKGMEELGLGSDPSTLKIKFSLGDTNQWIRNYGEYFQQTFKKTLGVEIELDTNEWATFQSKINNGEYQMGYMVWGIDYNDPFSMLSLMLSTSNSIPTGWTSEEYDSFMDQAAVEMDEAKRVELYKQAETLLLNGSGVLCPVVNETYNRYSYGYVKNLHTSYFTSAGLKYVYTSGR